MRSESIRNSIKENQTVSNGNKLSATSVHSTQKCNPEQKTSRKNIAHSKCNPLNASGCHITSFPPCCHAAETAVESIIYFETFDCCTISILNSSGCILRHETFFL